MKNSKDYQTLEHSIKFVNSIVVVHYLAKSYYPPQYHGFSQHKCLLIQGKCYQSRQQTWAL